MPYIIEEHRPVYDKEIESLIIKLSNAGDVQLDGDANYVISRIVAGSFKLHWGSNQKWSYQRAARAFLVFKAAAAEFYRRVLAPHEDKAIAKNGDIPEYM